MSDELYGDVGQQDQGPETDGPPQTDQTEQAIMPDGPASVPPQDTPIPPAPQAPTPPSAPTSAPSSAPQAQKPLAWDDVAAKPEFKSLPPEQQEAARNQYFQEVVAPQVPQQYISAAKQQFDEDTGPNAADKTTKFDKVMDVVNAPFAGITKGITETALGAAQLAGKAGNATGLLPNNWESDINNLRADAENETSKRYKDNPVASGLNTAGEFGEKVGEFGLLGGSSKAGYLQNMAAGAEQSALQPANNDKDRLLNAGIGGAAAGAGKYAGDTLSQLFPGEIPQAADIKAKAQDLYKQAEQAGGVVPSKYVNAWLDDVKANISTTSSKVKDNPVKALMDNLEDYRGKMMSYEQLQKLDSDLGEEAHAQFSNPKGGTTSYGKDVDKINDLLLQHMSNIPQSALPGGELGQQARNMWTQSAKLKQVEKIIDRANLGLNKDTTIRSGARTLYNNAKNTTAWTPEEKNALKDVATQGSMAGIAHLIGSRLNPIVWAAHSGPLGAVAAHAASTAGRGLAGAAQMAKAQQLARVIGGASKTSSGLLSQIATPVAPAVAAQAVNDENPTTGLLGRAQ